MHARWTLERVVWWRWLMVAAITSAVTPSIVEVLLLFTYYVCHTIAVSVGQKNLDGTTYIMVSHCCYVCAFVCIYIVVSLC